MSWEAEVWPQRRLRTASGGVGVLTLGFIYGAYFTETFRGAFLSVPRGQFEAGFAYGMSGWRVFHRIMFPQMMRFALPGVGNNWQVLLKATALVSIIGLADVVRASQDAGKSTQAFFFFTVVAGAIYLAITTVSNLVLMSNWKLYTRIILPSALRRSLPACSNEVILMLHATSLAFTATVPDILKVTRDANSATYMTFEAYGIAAVLYASIAFVLIWTFRRMEAHLMAYLKPQAH
ncbi:membrane hypothetical protein [Paraburkholderia ribeironis]|uniref:ABC transmembrane type-1 domain-containing protein n=1 Tax=Paraburkholderia ribeironis TaxID=1247936 RepID=A0A1N7RXQ9_9BURK|nr:membrane hypothetical protein [Paraburkholderia ribeironis]